MTCTAVLPFNLDILQRDGDCSWMKVFFLKNRLLYFSLVCR